MQLRRATSVKHIAGATPPVGNRIYHAPHQQNTKELCGRRAMAQEGQVVGIHHRAEQLRLANRGREGGPVNNLQRIRIRPNGMHERTQKGVRGVPNWGVASLIPNIGGMTFVLVIFARCRSAASAGSKSFQ